jgi:NAD(P)-dependent dehydrogenase (short-subunit alcohol dehydrogenase family)
MNKIDLHQRNAIITGGARGFGYAIAERMLQSGANVSLWDIDSSRLTAAKEKLESFGRVQTIAVELTDESEIAKALQAVQGTFGKIDILINNAGITGGNAPTWELNSDSFRKVIDVNLVAPFLICKAVVPFMLENGYGRIVNISSIAGKEGNPNASHYSASKAGLIALTKSLSKELATKNVLVNCVTPAAAKTELFDQMAQHHIDYMISKIPMGRLLQVHELAAMVTWLSSEECSFSTGAVFDISGGRAVY